MEQNPPAIIEVLAENQYGYSFVDSGLSSLDLADLDSIQIGQNKDYNQFGNTSDWESEISDFLTEIGPNSPLLADRIAHRVAEIAHKILSASEKTNGWICLRAGLSTTKYDVARWHMDAHYYPMKQKEIQYKFSLTLIGASTLFYPVPKERMETRKIIWRHMTNREFMNDFCQPNRVVSPKRGQGVYFIAGDCKIAAVHSEPPIDENRLFFSLVPCHDDEIDCLKEKVLRFYEKNRSVY